MPTDPLVPALTVGQLIEQLQQYPDHLEVYVETERECYNAVKVWRDKEKNPQQEYDVVFIVVKE